MSRILLISGPNLEILGERETEIYGSASLAELVQLAAKEAELLGHSIDHFSSNSEGEIVSCILGARKNYDGIIINPGALTHYAWSIHDALASFEGPVVELHISNPASREQWRKISVVAPVASGVVSGFGAQGYSLAIKAIHSLF